MTDQSNFYIDPRLDQVSLFSTRRMPHRTRFNGMQDAWTATRKAISKLEIVPGHIIEGTYSSRIEDKGFDVENVVFYNLEASTFQRVSQHGMRFRRCRVHESAEMPHHLVYRMIPPPSPPATPLRTLTFEPRKKHSVFDFWYAAGKGDAEGDGTTNGLFGLHIVWSGFKRDGNPAGRLKELLDGLIAAMQADDRLEEAVAKLARDNGVPAAEISDQLRNPLAHAILRTRNKPLLRAARKSPERAAIWNPEDHRCEECTLLIEPAATESIKAMLYAL